MFHHPLTKLYTLPMLQTLTSATRTQNATRERERHLSNSATAALHTYNATSRAPCYPCSQPHSLTRDHALNAKSHRLILHTLTMQQDGKGNRHLSGFSDKDRCVEQLGVLHLLVTPLTCREPGEVPMAPGCSVLLPGAPNRFLDPLPGAPRLNGLSMPPLPLPSCLVKVAW